MPVLSIVSPVYCEGASILIFLNAVADILKQIALSYEIILVDDGSSDNSWEHMHREAERRPGLRCLRLSRNFGKEAALAAGIEASLGDAVIILDSDLQHPPEYIPEMVRIWQADEADIVEARKKSRQPESQANALLAQTFYRIFSFLTRFNIEGASDFKLLDRNVVEAWKMLPERKMFFRGMTEWVGFRHRVISFTPKDRTAGATKWSLFTKLCLALDSLTAYTAKPLSLILGLGLFFCLFAVIVGGEAIWMKLTGQAMSGFTTVILLILVTGAAILGSICLLSIYVRQIFHETKGRPRYLICQRAEYGKRSAETHRRARETTSPQTEKSIAE